MADSQLPPQRKRPKRAGRSDYQRWWEVVQRAQAAVAEKPIVAVSTDMKAGSEVSTTQSVDLALIPDSVNATRPHGATPWSGEAASEAVEAKLVVESATSEADAGARLLVPERPWGNPWVAVGFWLVTSGILVAAAIALISVSVVAAVMVGVVAIVPVVRTFWGVYVARLEPRLAPAPRAERNVEEKPPISRGAGPSSGEASGGGPVAAA